MSECRLISIEGQILSVTQVDEVGQLFILISEKIINDLNAQF